MRTLKRLSSLPHSCSRLRRAAASIDLFSRFPLLHPSLLPPAPSIHTVSPSGCLTPLQQQSFLLSSTVFLHLSLSRAVSFPSRTRRAGEKSTKRWGGGEESTRRIYHRKQSDIHSRAWVQLCPRKRHRSPEMKARCSLSPAPPYTGGNR